MLHKQNFEPGPEHDLREVDRLGVRFTANVEAGPRGLVPVQVMNVSRRGFMALCDTPLPVGALITFTAPSGESFTAQIRWALDGRIGCRFEAELGWEDVLGLGIEELGLGESSLEELGLQDRPELEAKRR